MSEAVLPAVGTAVSPRPRPGTSLGAGHLWRLALADVRERTRRTGYLVSLAVMVWLGNAMLPPNGSNYRTFTLHDI